MNLRDASRDNYSIRSDRASHEEIRSGSLQRIADATELMARNHAELVAERDRYKRWFEIEEATTRHLTASIRAHKAHNTRLRRKAAHLEETRAAISEAIELGKAISQFTGFHYGPEHGLVGLAESMGLTAAEYAAIRDDLEWLGEKQLAALDAHFAKEAA